MDELFILIREPASNPCEWIAEQRQREVIKCKIYLEQQKTKLWRDEREEVFGKTWHSKKVTSQEELL